MIEASTRPAALADAVDEALASGIRHFAPPGHKRRDMLCEGHPELSRDITLLMGVEGQTRERGLLRAAEDEIARVWCADWARISVQGSTHGNLSLMLAMGGPGTEVIVPRNAHRSTLGGLILSGAKPLWVEPEIDQRTGLTLAVRPEAVRDLARRSRRLAGVVAVDPSYMGLGPDLSALRAVCDEFGVPLVVDAAWGAHFGFNKRLPEASLRAGAHAAVVSLHKTLPALTPASALLSTVGGPLDVKRLDSAFGILSTTSPPAAVQASADRVRLLMEQRGAELLDTALDAAQQARLAIVEIARVRSVGPEILNHESVSRWDPLKLVIDVSETGFTGHQVAERLRRERFQVAYGDKRWLVALLTIADDRETVADFTSALKRMTV